MIHLAIFASGTGSNTQKIIDYFRYHSAVAVSLIVSNQPTAGVLSIAAKEGIPTLLLEKERFFRGDGYSGGGSYFFGDQNASHVGLGVIHYDAKYGIPSVEAFTTMGFDWANVTIPLAAAAAIIPLSSPSTANRCRMSPSVMAEFAGAACG